MVFGPRGALASHREALQTLCLALNMCYALRILAMPLMRILLLARASQWSALRTFALLCQPGRCVDPLVSISCWALNIRFALRILAMLLMRILVLARALQSSALRTYALLCQPGRCVDPLVSTSCWALNMRYALRILAMPLMRILVLAHALQLSALRTFALLCQTGRCVDPLVSISCWALDMRFALRILAMLLMRILVLARALQSSALGTFALLCQPGRCVDPLVSTSSWARGRCLVFSWGVVGPTSTLFAGPPPFPSTLLGGGSGWLPLSGLPWIPASLAGFTLGST